MSDENTLDDDKARERNHDGDKQALKGENEEGCYHQRELGRQGSYNEFKLININY